MGILLKRRFSQSQIIMFTLILLFSQLWVQSTKGKYLNTAKEVENTLTFLFDTSPTSLKSRDVFTFLLKGTIPIRTEIISNCDEISVFVNNAEANEIIIYAFHGTEQGISINNEIIAWNQLHTIITKSKSSNHVFLSCYSSSIKPLFQKEVFTQVGTVDYVVATIKALQHISVITRNTDLAIHIGMRIKQGQKGLKLRSLFPMEPFWELGTHDFLFLTAWNWITQNSGLFDIPWLTRSEFSTYLVNDLVPSYNEHVDENDDKLNFEELDSLEELATLVEDQNDPSIRAKIEAGLWHISSDFDINLDLNIPGGSTQLASFALFDAADGVTDDHIQISFVDNGLSEQKVTELLQFIDPSTSSHSVINICDEIIQSGHYIQDQQNPFHTSLPDIYDDPKESLSINLQVNLDYDDLYLLAEEYFDQLVAENPLAWLLPTTWPPFLASALFLKESAFATEAALELYEESQNLQRYNSEHAEFEAAIDDKLTDASYKADIISYIDSISPSTVSALALQLAANPQGTLESWSADSRFFAPEVYQLMKDDQVNQAVEGIGKTRLQQAILRTMVLEYDYFSNLIGYADYDLDGMLDEWEVRNQLDPLSDDSQADYDSDALTNLQEFNLGTAANDFDSDNDGMDDGWEVTYNLNPLLICDAYQDPDGDELTNLDEYSIHGTDPTVYTPWADITNCYISTMTYQYYKECTAKTYWTVLVAGSYIMNIDVRYDGGSWTGIYYYSGVYSAGAHSYIEYLGQFEKYQTVEIRSRLKFSNGTIIESWGSW